jgi:hypothetical protein
MMIDPPSADQSTFDICHAGVPFSIRLATFLADGFAER